ncbi:hypothetical protein WJX74_001733 [Apatococcus lobatus]|uniref:L-ascorbate peroxidase n=1 Tax=Apatococcus lobatus TaxID=904363 RepID=A0AAW1QHP2_9CHLO
MKSTFLQGSSRASLVAQHPSRRVSSRTLVLRVSAKRPGENPVKAKSSTKQGLQHAKQDIVQLLKEKPCYPIMVRLAWHDAGTFSTENTPDWPNRGGANGSVRYMEEQAHAANAGLHHALELLRPIAEKYDDVGNADLFQLASAVSIEEAGGPDIKPRFGRRDTYKPECCVPEGRLPDGNAGPDGTFPDGTKRPGDHLRKVFYRMGFSDQDIVALSGAHTLGRARPDRSGNGKEDTKYTKAGTPQVGSGSPGGSSWTVQWLKFDNSYFQDITEQKDPELLVMETDDVLVKDDAFRPYVQKYAADQNAFFSDYAEAAIKLSELGVEWENEPFVLN